MIQIYEEAPLKNLIAAGHRIIVRPFYGISLLLCFVALLLCPLAEPAVAAGAGADSSRTQASARTDSANTRASAQPALWAKAVEIFELNKNLVPGKAFQKIEELDDEGRAKSQTDVEVSLALDSSGKVKSEIVRATKDKKDITADERKKAAERERKEAKKKATKEKTAKDKKDSDESSHSFSMDDGPFSAKMQPDVRVAESTARETIDSASCMRFEFSYPEKREPRSKGKPMMVAGTAWLDESSGRPIKVEYTFDPLPKHVKRMKTVLHYGAEAKDAWILKEMLFEASGSFLFFGKTMRGEIAFSDYWKYEGYDD